MSTMTKLLVAALMVGLASPALAQERDTVATTSPAPASAQAPRDSGHLVRIQHRRLTRTYEARVLEIGPDSLVLSVRDAQGERVVTIPRALIGRAWVSAGRARQTSKGVQIGAITGALMGLAAGTLAHTPCDSRAELCVAPDSPLMLVTAGMGIGVQIGGVVGAFVGSAVDGQNWQRVDPATLDPVGRAAPPPLARGARVQARLPELRVTGTLLGLSDTALVLGREDDGDSLSLSLQALRDVRILQPRQPSPMAILAFGAAGAIVGGVAGCSARAERACPLGIAWGATAGQLLGGLVRTDRWVRVPLPVVRWVARARNAR